MHLFPRTTLASAAKRAPPRGAPSIPSTCLEAAASGPRAPRSCVKSNKLNDPEHRSPPSRFRRYQSDGCCKRIVTELLRPRLATMSWPLSPCRRPAVPDNTWLLSLRSASPAPGRAQHTRTHRWSEMKRLSAGRSVHYQHQAFHVSLQS